MDKTWMRERRFSVPYVEGVKSFMKFVEDNLGANKDVTCPCNHCLNVLHKSQDDVLAHLMINGIDVGYTRWVYHGELCNLSVDDSETVDNNVDDGDDDEEDTLFDLLDEHQNFINSEMRDDDNLSSKGFDEYVEMLGHAQKELYPNCTKYSKLSFIVRLLHLKVYNKWSNKSFNMLLKLLKDILPEDNLVPKSYYEAKNMLRGLGLGYTPIHACRYDCVLYWRENELLEACPICKTSRWKTDDGKGKKIPWKILRYFPLTPRLRRLFMSSKTATEMRWHTEKRNEDDNWLRHPADAKEWKDFDKEFSWFAQDPRNVRLGLASDGFNPFGNMSTSYSMWPVILTPYNLTPWMCMKEHFLFMTLLIPGPCAPGKDIDIYMQPLINELQDLWTNGIETYDVHTKRMFKLHAAVKMKELFETRKDTDNPITPEEALSTVLGGGSGYCKGMGYGPTPPSSKRKRAESEISYLKEMNKRLAEENDRYKESHVEYERRQVEYERKQAEYERKQVEADKKQAEADKKQAEADERLAACDARQAVFQKFMERMMEKGLDVN